MTEILTTGYFKYNFDPAPVVLTNYFYVAETTNEESAGALMLGGYPDEVKENTDKINYLSAGTAAPNVICHGVTVASGTETNSYADTATLNGIYHSVAPASGITDFYYTFDLGVNGVPVSVGAEGFANNKFATYKIYAWNWDNSEWDQVGTETGQNTEDLVLVDYSLTIGHVGSGADDGIVRIRFYSSDAINLSIDRLLCSFATIYKSVGYANGSIWFDDSASNSDTVSYIDGVADNPVSTVEAALTLSNQLGIKSFTVNNGSVVVLPSNCDNFTATGAEWYLDLNGQSCDNTSFTSVIGEGTCTGDNTSFRNCILARENSMNTQSMIANGCILAGDLVFSAANDYYLNGCYAGIGGTAKPSIDFGAAVGDTKVNFRNYSGGIVIKNIGRVGSDILSLEGNGQLVLDSSCVSGLIKIRGNFTITDEVVGGFAGTIEDEARYDTTQVNDVIDDYTDKATYKATGFSIPNEYDAAIAALPTSAEIVTAIETSVIEGTLTDVEVKRIMLAALAGLCSGGDTELIKFRDILDTKDRITAVVDSDGNRLSITLDGE